MDAGTGGDRAVAQQLTIVNRKGLHARASARFVRTAECFDASITNAPAWPCPKTASHFSGSC